MPGLPLLRAARRIPWQAVLTLAVQVAQEGRERWDRLTPGEQRRVREAVTKSRGRLDRLSQGERQELRRILSQAFKR